MSKIVAAIVFAGLGSTASAQVPSAWVDVVKQFDTHVEADRVVEGSILLVRNGKVVARHQGKRTLDDKVTRYVPELRRVHDPYGRIGQ